MSSTPDERGSPRTRARAHAGPILVAVGENGQHVIRAASALAPALGDRVQVFSAVEPLPVELLASEPVQIPPSLEEGRREARLERLRARVDTLVHPSRQWGVDVEHGEPAAAICRRARTLDAPFLVMGIGRHHPIDRILASETTLRVIRRSSCPVFAVVGELPHLPSQIVVATDFSPQSALAVAAALPLLAKHATMHFVHVWEPSRSADPAVREIQEAYGSMLPGRFARFVVALHLPAGLSVRTDIREGKVAPQVLAFAESHHADLVVAGRHGMNAVARLFVGSVTTALVRGATCSVLVTPEPAGSDVDRLQHALTGTSTVRESSEWARELADFSRRNHGCRTTLEVDDPAIGAQTQETGYALMGASYDHRDRRVELMLGAPHAQQPHLTRNIAGVDSIAVLSDSRGRDIGLCVRHGAAQTLLMLTPEP